MAKYTVQFLATASSAVDVEAVDASEAREKAEEMFEHPSICAQCSGWGQSYNIDLSEWEQDETDDGVWKD